MRDVLTGGLTLASRAPGLDGAGADGPSTAPTLSANGRFVAFQSQADNLQAADSDAVQNVFRRDLQAGAVTLVSRDGLLGAGAVADSFVSAVSADGRFVAFTSGADNLSAQDDDAFENAFVRDLDTGEVTLVSRATGADGAPANDVSTEVSLSADGRVAAFSSRADNLSADDDDALTNVFVRDLRTGALTLASRATGATGAAADRSSVAPSLSGDGRTVAFQSLASNLSDEDADATLDVFVRELRTERSTLVSRAAGANGAAGDDGSSAPSLSDDGRVVAFVSEADNLSDEDENQVINVFARNLETEALAFASRATGPSGAAADEGSFTPSLSGDGRFVAFASEADNLSAADDNAVTNVFRRDVARLTGPRCAGRLATAGTSGDDTIVGTPGRDVFAGRDGADQVFGVDGDDLLCGDAGADVVVGQNGDDRVIGGPGLDSGHRRRRRRRDRHPRRGRGSPRVRHGLRQRDGRPGRRAAGTSRVARRSSASRSTTARRAGRSPSASGVAGAGPSPCGWPARGERGVRCRGALTLRPSGSRRVLARGRYRIRPGRRATVTVIARRGALPGRVVARTRERGKSRRGPRSSSRLLSVRR